MIKKDGEEVSRNHFLTVFFIDINIYYQFTFKL